MGATATRHREKPFGFRSDIEGLRGIAILLVVVFHAQSHWVRGGFVGVDVFFVLSGYLITGLIFDEITRSGRVDVARFYARRTRRLLPACVVMLLSVILVAHVVYSPLEQETLAHTAKATAAYWSNLWFMRQATDYFGADVTKSPLLHTWSLAVEEQFYLAWPFLIALTASRKKASQRQLLIIMSLVSGVSLAVFIYLTKVNGPWAFFGSPARAWEFGFGGLACFFPAEWMRSVRGSSARLRWLGLFAILLAGIFFPSRSSYFPAAVLTAVLGTVLVLIVGAAGPPHNPILSSAFLQQVGKLSYSWYLWHWPVLVFATLLFPGMQWYGTLACVLGSYGLAILSYLLVENPIRFNPGLSRHSLASLMLAATLTGIALSAGTLWQRAEARSPEFRRFARAQRDIPRLYADGCHAALRVSVPKDCVFGDTTSSVSVVLFGDSKAAQWFPALEKIAIQQHWKLLTLTHSACPAAYFPIFEPKLGRVVPECARWRDAAIARIATIRPDLIIISESSEYNETPGKPLPYALRREGMRKTLSRLDSMGLQTVVLRDSPHAPFDVPICLARLQRHEAASCSFPRQTTTGNDAFQADSEAARGLSHTSMLDMTDQICGPVVCNAMEDDGLIVYHDRNHLTATFAETLSTALAAHLIPLIADKFENGRMAPPIRSANSSGHKDSAQSTML
jgi:peptidoglycan/LPS O-acetylase OafA/YrhL